MPWTNESPLQGSFLLGGDTLLKVLNQNLKPVAVLENAFSIGYNKSTNELWTAFFSMPLNDPKNEECKPLYYLEIVDEDEYIGLFRIIPSLTIKNESGNTITYQLEHVLATLLDDVLFLYHQNDHLTTAENIQYVLDRQTTKHWKLGQVDFTRYFSYKWENSNLLSALFSIPNPFDVSYRWTWDTTSYPWTLNLEEPDSAPSCEIRYAKNMIGIEREIDPSVIYNRIYLLGYGEGDNQLTISEVNNGITYVEDAASIAKYGLKSYIFVDRRFENPESLKATGKGLLRDWKEPKVTYRGTAADISTITGEDTDKLQEGKVVRIIDPDLGIFEAKIVTENKPDIKGAPGIVYLEIANKTEDIGTTQADMERRQQINELYSQGATNISNYSYNDNADPDHPAEIEIYLPEELVKINKLILSFKTTEFRAYERAIEGGGAISKSTAGGGGTTKTTSTGGGVSKSTSSGGGSSKTSSSGGSHRHEMFFHQGTTTAPSTWNNYIAVADPNGQSGASLVAGGYAGSLYTRQASGNHTHSVDIPAHTHNFEIPHHDHSITLGTHTHDFEIPNHTHGIQFGIFKLSRKPTAASIKVDGNTVPHTQINGDSIDLIPYLSKGDDGKVTRGWHTVSITPNDLGRINAQIYTQFFIQSRGGGSF